MKVKSAELHAAISIARLGIQGDITLQPGVGKKHHKVRLSYNDQGLWIIPVDDSDKEAFLIPGAGIKKLTLDTTDDK